MSHEFKLHHYVNQLIGTLGVGNFPNTPGAEVLTSILEKNASTFQITQASAANAKKKMEDMLDDPTAFSLKYDELKNKNVKNLDALVSVMLKVKKDPHIQALFEHSGKSGIGDVLGQGDATINKNISTISDSSTTSDKLSTEELQKLKKELSKMAGNQAAMMSSDAVRKISKKEKKHVHLNRTLNMPSWMSNRPYLSADFVSEHIHDPHNTDQLNIQQQEECIVTDLLFCLGGISGRYIVAEVLEHKHAIRQFNIHPSIDGSLGEMAKRILPLCSHYSNVTRFIEEQFDFTNGLVNQALAAAFRTIVNDYMILITQLEQQQKKHKLSLQKLWFYVQSPMQTFHVLNDIVTTINKGNLTGGGVLSLLHDKIPSYLGNNKAQQLCVHLTKCASLPYFHILEKWIYKGIIVDHYNEFLVKEDDSFTKERLGHDFNYAYWGQKYTVLNDNTPVFLQHVTSKILNTGKYLNVIRQSGRDLSSSSTDRLEYSVEGKDYVAVIDANFQWASSLLLDLLMKEMDLMTRLRSLKHYFMLDQGDFIVQFMDLTENELKKPMDDILLPRLHTLLELSLRTSSANVDPYKDDLKVDLLPCDLITQLFKILFIETKQEELNRSEPTDLHLSGLESFSFDYEVSWPVSLVLNRKALTRYQLLSRHLFYAKHVERQLCNIWLKDKGFKDFHGGEAVKSLRAKAYALRQRMLNFVQNLEYYSMFEVVEPLWQQFERDMAQVKNIDEVLVLHHDLLDTCLSHCMLTNPRLLKILYKLMMICINFCTFMHKLSAHLTTLEESSESSESSRVKHTQPSNEKTISMFEHNFSKHLVELMDKIVEFSGEQRLITFVHRLDYNGFYKNEIEKMSASRMQASMSEQSSS